MGSVWPATAPLWPIVVPVRIVDPPRFFATSGGRNLTFDIVRPILGAGVGPDPALYLYERDDELAAIEELVVQAVEGRGAALHLRGAPGLGKSSLIRAAAEVAAGAGVRILAGRGTELEREHAFGVTRQLFGPLLLDGLFADDLASGAAGLAAPVFEAPAASPGAPADPMAVYHGLYWLCASAAEQGPLLLCVDDAHWADAQTLLWLRFMQPRLEGSCVALISAARPHPTGALPALDRLLADRAVTTRELRPLSEAAGRKLIRRRFGAGTEDAFARVCHEVTAGNPFFLEQLQLALEGEGVAPLAREVERLRRIAPIAVSDAVLARLGALGGEAVDLARALAVLGEAATIPRASELAGREGAAAANTVDALASEALLESQEPLSFAHPIVQIAVYEDIPAGLRGQLHRGAARLLERDGAPAEQVAAHLLRATPAADPWAAAALARGARTAAQRAAPELAGSLLRRALAEPPAPAERRGLLLELGRLEAARGSLACVGPLSEAFGSAAEPVERAQAALVLGSVLVTTGRTAEALDIASRARVALPAERRELALLLEGVAVMASYQDATLMGVLDGRLEQLEAELAGKTPGERVLLGHIAFRRVVSGDPAERALTLGGRALSDGRLTLEAYPDHFACFAPAAVFMFADRPDRACELLTGMLDAARRTGPAFFSGLSTVRADAILRQGDLRGAEEDARQALEVQGEMGSVVLPQFWLPQLLSVLGLTLLEGGRLDEADEAVGEVRAETDLPRHIVAFLEHARGRVNLARGRPAEALAAFRAAGQAMDAMGAFNPDVLPWRSGAALALAATGERQAASSLAAAEVDLSRAVGTPGPIGVALRTQALINPRGDVELLRQAAEALADSRRRLEQAHTLIELGAALRRHGSRREARQPLREGMELAARCGAMPLQERAREELLATGARPRRIRLSGLDALTASERRVARLAAGGRSNREIAESLYVTRRTVETHLSHAYQKLDIESREELSAALESPGRDT
jgi:DNA-binding CsgD family transcriptional regulator